jgi:ComF family protein
VYHKLRSITQCLRLPSICVLCNQFHKSSLAVCDGCIALISPLGTACTYCAYPLFDGSYLICGQCIKNPPYFDNSYIAYTFEEPLRSLLHHFKYHNGLYLKTFLSHLILQALPPQMQLPQCLIPVPLHPKKLKVRGFNQAALLTTQLAKKLRIPYDLINCQKVVNTEPQASLDGEQRKKNVRGAFQVNFITYQHVALVDDLLTTGSTANEIARTLKNAGVKKVDVWCCARTVVKG